VVSSPTRKLADTPNHAALEYTVLAHVVVEEGKGALIRSESACFDMVSCHHQCSKSTPHSILRFDCAYVRSSYEAFLSRWVSGPGCLSSY